MMRALLDANIFFSTWVTDPLLSFADADFFEPLWSERIMDEVCEHLPEVWSRATPTGIKRYVNLLNQAYPDAAVTGWEPLAPAIVLPDTDGRAETIWDAGTLTRRLPLSPAEFRPR